VRLEALDTHTTVIRIDFEARCAAAKRNQFCPSRRGR
jgi:hypothetical protein